MNDIVVYSACQPQRFKARRSIQNTLGKNFDGLTSTVNILLLPELPTLKTARHACEISCGMASALWRARRAKRLQQRFGPGLAAAHGGSQLPWLAIPITPIPIVDVAVRAGFKL